MSKLIVEIERDSKGSEISKLRIRHGYDRGVCLDRDEARDLARLLGPLFYISNTAQTAG